MVSSSLVSALLVAVAGAGQVLAQPLLPRAVVGPEHFEVLAMRASSEVDPNAVSDVQCTNPDK